MKNKVITLQGTIAKGLGEGYYFISMPHYRNEIKKKLGFTAYPGTLNINIKKNQSIFIKKINPIRISGYKKDGKKFGAAICYMAKIGNIKGSIIIPEINKHKENIIEFIAPIHVKTKLKVGNGKKITIELL